MPSSSATSRASCGCARPETRTRRFSSWVVIPVIGLLLLGVGVFGGGVLLGGLGGAGGIRARAAACGPSLDVVLPDVGAISLRHREGAGGDVVPQRGARTGVGTVADRDRRHEHRVGADAYVGADRRREIGRAHV